MSQDTNPIDELFRNELSGARISPPSGVWEGIAASQSAAVVKTAWYAGKWFLGSAGALAVAGTAWLSYHLLSDKTRDTVTVTNQSVQVNPAPSDAVHSARQAGADSPKTSSADAETRPTAGFYATRPGANTPEKSLIQVPENNPENGLYTPDPHSPDKQPLPAVKPVVKPGNVGNTGKNPCKHSLSILAEKLSGTDYQFTAKDATSVPVWYFGDGYPNYGYVVTHSYPAGNEGTYLVKAITQLFNGCADSAVYKVVVKAETEAVNVFVPDYLTPNGDGKNDDFYITLPPVSSYDLLIFDPLDRQVFRSSNPQEHWDGTCNRTDCPAGTYRVVLRYQLAGASEPVLLRRNLLLTR
ncbi:MAG: gliding motility-associated C-terminal domain-containing protein [Bacteroidetes bacterium]|nr:gliding motility-associated C-terminal domain-containing protein [Bacteroidota bacterium]